MWETIKQALQWFRNWLVETVLSMGSHLIAWIFNVLPTDANGQISSGWNTIAFALSAANAWAPLDFAITLAGLYVAFVCSFLAIKVAIKLIP